MSHSPEPWQVGPHVNWDIPQYFNSGGSQGGGQPDDLLTILDADGSEVINEPFEEQDREDYDRIVACVNACRGIPTEELAKPDSIIELARRRHADRHII